ncbi:uncharacterized protein PAC_16092 [Phialocephala subalpina]|uniref:Rdx family-domain-containing protein n=1 Tax=Phialocephala subalpina TaxID=576137 RepID=A0A1L7XMA6_9HELO|nr:uncharacterized protein PAC_16092 [Phialocephala subalpina]
MEQGPFPRITIQFCTQCKWMLRAAYFAQELLSTFSTSLGEVALQPSTGGTFVVHLYNAVPDGSGVDGKVTIQQHLLWDRKAEGGFPGMFYLSRLMTPSLSLLASILLATLANEGSLVCIPEPARVRGTVDCRFGILGHHNASAASCNECPSSCRAFEAAELNLEYPMIACIRSSGSYQASETKELKRRVRDIIDPSRDLGHVDGKKSTTQPTTSSSTSTPPSTTPNPSSSTFTPIPKAINRLQALPLAAERKFTPMDVDVSSRPGSSRGEGLEKGEGGGEVLNSRGKIVIGGGDGESFGFCRPGEACEDCG